MYNSVFPVLSLSESNTKSTRTSASIFETNELNLLNSIVSYNLRLIFVSTFDYAYLGYYIFIFTLHFPDK